MKIYRWFFSIVVLTLLALSFTVVTTQAATPNDQVPGALQATAAPTQVVTPTPTLNAASANSSSQPASTDTQSSSASTKVADKDKMTEILIPAGEFTMGASTSDPDARQVENKDHSAVEVPSFKYTLPDYWIDKF